MALTSSNAARIVGGAAHSHCPQLHVGKQDFAIKGGGIKVVKKGAGGLPSTYWGQAKIRTRRVAVAIRSIVKTGILVRAIKSYPK